MALSALPWLSLMAHLTICIATPTPAPFPTPVPTPTPTPSPSAGTCIGNDSRCAGKDQAACPGAAADCRWNVPPTNGACKGNDSTCTSSPALSQTNCLYFKNQGKDCTWDSTASPPTTTTAAPTTTTTVTTATTTTEVVTTVTTVTTTTELLIPSPSPAPAPSPTPLPSPSPTPSPTPGPCPSTCKGNDSNCAGKDEAGCKGLTGSDCKWICTVNPTCVGDTGTCTGNDSRCVDSDCTRCKELDQQGTDCKWKSTRTTTTTTLKVGPPPPTVGGTPPGGDCQGTNSACAGSNHAKCVYLNSQGLDCSWDGFQANSATCAGPTANECSVATTEAACNAKTGCTWRKDVVMGGGLSLKTANATAFVEHPGSATAVATGIGNVIDLDPKYIPTYLTVQNRRLATSAYFEEGQVRRLLTETVLATYVIVIGAHVPSTFTLSSADISQKLSGSNINNITAAISSAVAATMPGVVVQVGSVTTPKLNIHLWQNTTTTLWVSNDYVDEDGAVASGCAHALLLTLGIVFMTS